MKHACIDNRTVVDIVEVTSDEQLLNLFSKYSSVVFIGDLLIQPEIGWVLNGAILEPGPNQQISIETLISSRIKFYQESAPELLRELYTTNTLLGITVQQSDQMFEDFSDVLLRIREGAWPTALYRLSQKQPSGFVTQEMLDSWYQTILNKML